MAAKEATVYIVDVGATMQERNGGRSETNFDWAMRYVWDKITTTISTGRKTLYAGVLALRSEETRNELSETDEHYKHVAVLHELEQMQMQGFRTLRSELVAGSQHDGDVLDALIIAIHMITKTCRKLAFKRRVVLVTDARANMATDDLREISEKLVEDQIELIVLGVDFDDLEFGFKEEDKDAVKLENEENLRKLCKDTNGTFGTVAQAIDELSIPRVKQTKPVQSYKGYLSLGGKEYQDDLNILVERYPKTMVAKAPSASRYVIRSGMEATQSSATLSNGSIPVEDDLASIRNARTYQINDGAAPGGKREVNLDELAKGYEYGRTAVHISEGDQNVTAFETPQGLDIIGFVDATQYERYLDMARTNIILPERSNPKASMALSSFIHALYELESFAVARFVAKLNKQPLVVLLTPCIEPDFECLYEIELPFAEDVRSYRFPPLDRVVTVSGKSISVHRNLPSADLQQAMDEYVDEMDLSAFGQDDDGEPAEYMQLDETFSPVLHHLNHVIRQRAIYPDREPPKPADILTKYSSPPADLVRSSNDALERVIAAADVKKVPPKVRGKRFGKKEEKPLSNLDVAALLAADPTRKQNRINPANAVPEFKQAIHAPHKDISEIHEISKQLQNIIIDWTKHSVGDHNHGKILEATKVMREELEELEEPATYNDFMRDFKKRLFAEELGGNRRDLWFAMRVSKQVGLITKRESDPSTVTDEEAIAFMSAK